MEELQTKVGPKLISAILVLFVVLSALVIPTAAQSTDYSSAAPRGEWNPTTSTGTIILDGESYYTVFQGEEDVQEWRTTDGSRVPGLTLTNPNGRSLRLTGSISESQETGKYSAGTGVTVRVAEPRVSVDVFDADGEKVGSGAEVRANSVLLVGANWNYAEAEDIEIEVIDSDTVDDEEDPGTEGTNVETKALSSRVSTEQLGLLPDGFNEGYLSKRVQGVGSTGYRTAFWGIDVSKLSAGEYEIHVTGVDDLNSGSARETFKMNVGNERRAYVTTERSSVPRGDLLRYTVSGSQQESYHAVGVRVTRLRSGADANRLFGYAGDTVEVGSTRGYAYAVLEAGKDGTASGLIDTSLLKPGSSEMVVYPGRSKITGSRSTVGESTVDTTEFGVEEGRLSTNLGGLTYVVGDSVDIKGTASPGIDTVALYVQGDGGNWHLLPLNGEKTTDVTLGTWEARDVVLSDESFGGRLLRFPGVYTVSAVDADDIGSPPPRILGSSEMEKVTGSESTIRVTTPVFFTRFSTVGGEVARGDGVGVRGVSVGSEKVVVGFIGEEGSVTASVERTSRGSAFESRDIRLDSLGEGSVTAFGIVEGRDGVFGDELAENGEGNTVSLRTAGDFRRFVESFEGRNDILGKIRSESVDERGSDDLISVSEFRLSQPSTKVRTVVPLELSNLSGVVPVEVGETVVVRGVTNRNPESTEIEVRVTQGPSPGSFEEKTIRDWDTKTGTWSTVIDTEGVSPGRYVLEASDGSSSDTTTFEVVAEGKRDLGELNTTGTLQERVSKLKSKVESLRQENTRLRERIDDLRRNMTPRNSSNASARNATQPKNGFGFGVFLVSIVTVSALAFLRRKKRAEERG